MEQKNKMKTEIRIRLYSQKTINLYNQYLASLKAKAKEGKNTHLAQSQNEALEVLLTKVLEEELLQQHFSSLEERLYKVINQFNKNNLTHIYNYVDKLIAQIFNFLVINDKKMNWLMNLFAEVNNLDLEYVTNPHNQQLSEMEWVKKIINKISISPGIIKKNK